MQRKAVELKPQNALQPGSGLDFARRSARIARDMHAEDVVILDLRGISSVADFFVIGTGTSDRQMRAIADEIEVQGLRVGQKRYGISGYESPSWLLLDYVDVVIHLFDPAKRHYYDLELLWGDAPRIEWQEPGDDA
ncbi:MAG: ribosome silencing factor [Phycisphaerae bacterium]